MPMPTGFEQARLKVEGGTTIDCWFNPTQYAIAKSNQYEGKASIGSSFPVPQFGGGNARQLTVELLFDSSPDGDVSTATDQLFLMMEVDAGLGTAGKADARPPKLQLSWGKYNSFPACCTSLNVQFTMFRPDGVPTRATASLTLLQAEEDKRTGRGSVARPQNPTTRSDVQLRAHVVRDGDTLQSIAYEQYGDPTRWRHIAKQNGIDDPLRLTRGRSLSIPLEPA
jgi:hypothetical protein